LRDALNILAVTRKPTSASFEQRVLNHIEPLRTRGVNVTRRTLGHSQSEQRDLIREARGYDGLWWHRHLLPIWTRRHLSGLGCPVVFDYDDPLIFSSRGNGRMSLTRRLRFAAMLRRCDAAFAASHYLRDLGQPYCNRITIQPMAVDVPASVPQRKHDKNPVEILWIGQRTTQIYLEQIRGVLEELGAQRRGVRLRLVAHEPMTFGSLPVDFRSWSRDEQAAAMRECDIGLCPMPDTIWTRGKCPYKVLQYMAHAMAWVGSAVGENLRTAGEGTSDQPRGLCASNDSQWLAAIGRLIDDGPLRRRIGSSGRAYVEHEHNRPVVADRLAQTWRQITAR